MPETQVIDEVVSTRARTGGQVARPMVDEVVEAGTGVTKTIRAGVEEETTGEGGKKGRSFKESTLKLMEKLDKPDEGIAPHEQGDADEDDAAEGAATGDGADAADGDDADEGEKTGEGEKPAEGEATKDDAPKTEDVVKEWQTKAEQLEAHNRHLVSENEQLRGRKPTVEREAHEKILSEAWQSYVEEGSVPALRKFLGAVVGAAPDSKEVDSELAGLYTDLTSRELNVPLTESQAALREAARARLALARDKRERTAAQTKTTEPANGGEDGQRVGQVTQYVGNLLTVKAQGGTSIADEFPLLMSLSEDFDGVAPSELIARAMLREAQVGTLPPTLAQDELACTRFIASKIEKHYKAVADKISTKTAKNNTAQPTGKNPTVANKASTEPRQSHGARTLTNATASVAPATPPKVKSEAKPKTGPKTRKDFKSDAEWRSHLLAKHIPE